LADRVKAATGANGIDVILDMSVGHIWLPILQMIAPDGRIGHLSTGGGNELSIPLRTLTPKRISITGSLLCPLDLQRPTIAARSH